MRTADRLLRKFLEFFPLNLGYRLIKGILPSSVVKAVNKATLKNGYMPLVYAEKIEPKYESAWKYLQSLGVELGDYLEFGVSLESSMACMHRVVSKLNLTNIRLFGFDSFQSMHENAAVEDRRPSKPGEFANTVLETEKFLNTGGIAWNRTCLIEGKFDGTLNVNTTQKLRIIKGSIIRVDCSSYSAAKSALNHSMPVIVDYTVIFFDDWNDDETFGTCKAYSEFLSEHKHLFSVEFGMYPPTGKIFVVKNTKISRRVMIGSKSAQERITH